MTENLNPVGPSRANSADNPSVQILPVTGDARETLFRFRHNIFCLELGWISTDHASDGLLHDRFDDVALNFAAFSADGSVVGSVRVIPDSPTGLPIERNVCLKALRKRARPAEISRLAVTQSLRRTNLSALLMRAGYRAARRTGHDFIVLDTYLESSNQSLPLYERLGFVRLAEPYEDPEYNYPAQVVALGLDCPVAESTLSAREPTLHHFFCRDGGDPE